MKSSKKSFLQSSEILKNEFIRTDIPEEGIYFENTILNEIHILKEVRFTNLTEKPLGLSLTSDIGNAIGFQLENENLKSFSINAQYPVQLDYFNLLFNDMNLINEFELQAKQTQSIIISFRPLLAVKAETIEEEERISQIQSKRNIYSFHEVKANILLSIKDQEKLNQLPIPLFARVCRSVLKITDHELTFSHCVPGGTYVKDINLWNASEMPLSFKISVNAEKRAGTLEFFDHDTTVLLNGTHTIPGFYHTAIRATYKAGEVGEHILKVILENKNDSNNIEILKVHVTVSQTPVHQDSIVVNESIQFGDCYTGCLATQLLSIRNVTEIPLDVQFKSDHPAEVHFAINEKEVGSEGENSEKFVKLSLNDSVSFSPQLIKSQVSLKKLVNPIKRVESHSFQEKQWMKIEEVTVNPGVTRVIQVLYTPERIHEIDSRAGTLEARNFNIFLKATDGDGKTRQKTTVKAFARVCTSIIHIPKTLINMGDSLINNLKTGVIEIMNISELDAHVNIQLESKVVSFPKEQVIIPPKQSEEIIFNFFPRKATPNYKKQITFLNKNNPGNEFFVEIYGNNIDNNQVNSNVPFRIIFPNSEDHLDFGSVVVNSPMLRSFNIKNLTQKELKLNLTSLLPDEINIYKEGVVVSPKKRKTKNSSSKQEKSSNRICDFLDLASNTSEKRDGSFVKKESSDLISNDPPELQDLVNMFSSKETIPLFSNFEEEHKYILQKMTQIKSLENAISMHRLLPVGKFLHMHASEERTVYFVLKPIGSKRPSVKGKLQRFISKILLSENNPETSSQFSSEVLVTAKICRSIMNLAQRNINFGHIRRDDHKAKFLVVGNLSEVPLLFQIKKSTESMASLDVKISEEDLMGVILPYRSREVRFFFQPTLSLSYNERLVIKNIYDQTNNQIVSVKAHVLQSRSFFLKSLDLDFGQILLDEESTQIIVLTNIGNKKRSFTIASDKSSFSYCHPKLTFQLENYDNQSQTNQKVASGVGSLTFSLEPGSVQKIRAIFTPQLIQKEKQEEEDIETLTHEENKGTILVYETKNNEINKKINFSAKVYFDKAALEKTFAPETSLKGESAPVKKSQIKVRFLNVKGDMLDLGNCFIHPKDVWAKEVALTLENVTEENLSISAQSNLMNEVFIFQNEAHTQTAEESDPIVLGPKSVTTIYVCVKPNTKFLFDEGDCRHLAGGIRFKIRSNKKNTVEEMFLKFKGIVGQSISQVSPQFIDLGITRKLNQKIHGSFKLLNLSKELPLQFEIVSSSKRLVCDIFRGVLEGSENSPETSQRDIRFSFFASSYGLWKETISIKNSNSPQIHEIRIRLFADENLLETNLKDSELFIKDIALDQLVLEDVSFKSFSSISFYVRNKSATNLVLHPKSNLGVLLQWGKLDENQLNNSLYIRSSDDSKKFTVCGPVYQLLSQQRVQVHVIPYVTNSTLPSREALSQGKRVNFTGELLFEKNSGVALKAISVKGSFCVSLGEVTNTVDLGKLGYDNEWKDCDFEFEIRNISETVLIIQLDSIPDCISIPKYLDKIQVEPLKTLSVRAVFSPLNLPHSAGQHQTSIRLININNPSNIMNICVICEITTCRLKMSVDELTLPQLMHPSTSCISNEFSVENAGHKRVTLRFVVELTEEMKNFIAIEVLSKQTKISCERHFSLSPSESMDVLVQVWAKSDVRVPPHFLEGQLTIFGKLIAFEKSGTATDAITLIGSLVPGSTFSLSTTRLHFDSNSPSVQRGILRKSFSIVNLLANFPLEYKIATPKSPGSVLIDVRPSEGTIAPCQSQIIEVDVTLKVPEQDHLSESHSILISDIQSKAPPQAITVSILAETRPKSPTKKVKKKKNPEKPMNISEELPELGIKGATALDNNRYEINLGQHSLNSGPVIWELEIENNSSPQCSIPLEYKISTIDSQNDRNWISISSSHGILKSSKESHKIQLRFETTTLDTYSTYLLIKNLNNPNDIRTIRISLKIVSSHNTYFSVYVGGKKGQMLIVDLGDIYFNRSYRDNAVVISNESEMPLDFVLSSNEPHGTAYEINFSLSRTSLNLFTSITVDAKSNIKVFLHFRANRNEIEEGYTIEKKIEIYISCTLIKDYQQMITLRAQCSHAQLNLNSTSFVFSPHVAWPKRQTDTDYQNIDITFPKEQKSRKLVISNNFNSDLTYILKNNSLFFTVDGTKEGVITSKYVTHSITIRPNIPIILNNRQFLLKEKYVEEHLTLYNKKKYTDKWWISLRVSFGSLEEFNSAPGPQVNYPYTVLEGLIVSFLRDFSTFWNTILSDQRKKLKNPKLTYVDLLTSASLDEIDDSQIYFNFRYITDELVYYGLKKQVARSLYKLAELFFTTILHHEVFLICQNSEKKAISSKAVSLLQKWLSDLFHFLGFFPESKTSLSLLRNLGEELHLPKLIESPPSLSSSLNLSANGNNNVEQK